MAITHTSRFNEATRVYVFTSHCSDTNQSIQSAFSEIDFRLGTITPSEIHIEHEKKLLTAAIAIIQAQISAQQQQGQMNAQYNQGVHDYQQLQGQRLAQQFDRDMWQYMQQYMMPPAITIHWIIEVDARMWNIPE